MSQMKIKKSRRPQTWGELQMWMSRAKHEYGDEFVQKHVRRVVQSYGELTRSGVPEEKARQRSLTKLPGFTSRKRRVVVDGPTT